jgi:tetratricopeptide (TPR) repeat protein
MENTACYRVVMPNRGGVRARLAAAAILAAALAALSSASCAPPPSAHIVGEASERKELSDLFGLLRDAGDDPERRFAVLRRISSNLTRRREYESLAAFLSSRPESGDASPYGAWCLYTAACAYEDALSAPIAAIYYDRVLKLRPDVLVEGRSLHRECLSRLIAIVDSPERRIGYYKDYLSLFPDEEPGKTLFLLAREYERSGDLEEAVKAYSEFLPFFGTEVPGYPDAFRHARDIVDYYNSPKDWAFRDLRDLVDKLRAALAAADSTALRACRAKIYFFTTGWNGDERQSDGRGFADFGQYLSGARIQSDPAPETSADGREAYLKTWGWTDKISTWYLYFRRIHFPANPNVHGSWEWAGIYFGERTQ